MGPARLRVGVLSAFPPGRNSLNEFGFHLVRHLASKEEVDEVILFADETDAGPPDQLHNVTPVVSWRFNDPTNVVRIARAVRRHKPDVLLVNLQFASFGDTRLAGGLGLLTPALMRRLGVPTGVILHNLVENVDMEDAGFAGSKLAAKAMTFAGRCLTKAILQADYVALTIPRYVELLRESYGAGNAILAPHGAMEEVAEPSYDVPAGNRILLAFGKWGTYKTVETLLLAHERLIGRGYDDIEVVIAGTDSPNAVGYLAGVAKEFAHLPRVRFTGYVAEQDVAGLFSSATITVFPYTSTTGSSGVLHQAGTYGRAAVLPAIGDFAEVIEEEGFAGEYFEPGDAESMADSLAKLLDDDGLRVELGRRNYIAAAGIPMSEVIDWHLIHLEAARSGRR